MNTVLTKEFPYQVVMVIVILELLILAALMPRGFSAEPLAYPIIAALRLGGLCVSAFALRDTAPRHAFAALTIWGALLAPPELWSYALEARAGLPVTLFGSLLIAGGVHSSAHLSRRLTLAFVAFGLVALTWSRFDLTRFSNFWIVLIALCVALMLVVSWRRA
jgi:hypothetical protein